MKEYGLVEENVDLKKYNTYGIGGGASYLVRVESIEKLGLLLKYLNNNNISWYVLGGGSNVLLPDEDYDGVIIKLDALNSIIINKDIIKAEAGVTLGNFVKVLLDEGYTNYAPLMGIPGTLGGAIIGNAGSFGVSIMDYLVDVTIMDSNGVIKTLNKENIKYDYRYTEFKGKKDIIVSATFKGIKGNVAEAKEQIKINLEKRKNTQPLEYKNAGSVFKNPPEYSAGYLIEHVGLKDFAVGGAKVSEKHANFIINFHNATSRDIIKLIGIIQDKVFEKFYIELKLEQVIVKWENHGKKSKKENK